MTRINIDDDMVDRAWSELQRRWANLWGSKAAMKAALQAALDSRTGPKDRRVEIDDVIPPRPTRRSPRPYVTRRVDDGDWRNLPRKSDRLKREAQEREKQRAQEIHVSEGMRDAGYAVAQEYGWPFARDFFDEIYISMRLQEMKERGQ